MLEKIFNRTDVKKILVDTITQSKLIEKEIPNTICGEKMQQEQYCLYLVIDAIIKYFIIVDDENNFDDYLDQLKQIVKKIKIHNDLVMAVNRLLVKFVQKKLNITNLNNKDQTKKIITYFYNKYIQEGYLFYVLPNYFYDEGKCLNMEKYNSYEMIEKQVSDILDKYKIENPLSNKKEDFNNKVKITDSAFMMGFYAYNSPELLYQLGYNLIRKNSKKDHENSHFFFREYYTCLNNLDNILRKKEIPLADKNRILEIFKSEWKKEKLVSDSLMVTFVKRKMINKDNLDDYQKILDSNLTLDEAIHYILDIRYDEYISIDNITKDFCIN